QIDITRFSRRVIDTLGCLHIVGGLCEEDIWHEGLWVPVIKREPCRLNLDHDAVTRLEYMVHRRQTEAICKRLVRRDGLRPVKTFTIAAPEDIHRDTKFVAA